MSICLNTDSYKVSMDVQYPAGTTGVYSHVLARGGDTTYTVFMGIQYFITSVLSKPVSLEDILEAEEIYAAHGVPFNKANWMHILHAHNGYLPLRIRAVPEGTRVPTGNVLVTVENTDPKCFWLTTWIETALLRAVWYPTTVATNSAHIRSIIEHYLELTGSVESIDFKLHDFGARGVSSAESAAVGGLAHLVNFKGTDNVLALKFARTYYSEPMAGFSIPAAEHSTITSWTRENETDAYRNMLQKFGSTPNAMFAVVSDSYDVFNAVENIFGEELREEIIASNATVIIRPDSGDPETICARIVKILDSKFGHTINAKGYRVLNNVRIIQGDGVNHRVIRAILANFMINGYSADNISFGMGGALLQQLDRDTYRFAMKASAVQINDIWVPIQKDPVTDRSKRSLAGRVTLYKDKNKYYSGVEDWNSDALETVYLEGVQFNKRTLAEVRANAYPV